jgi:transglutaminase-like putative cysteine protease
MKDRWCLKMANPRKIISLLAALGATAAVAAMLVWLAPGTLADNAPDWLRAAAQDKLPEYPKETIAVMLLEDIQTVVKDNGEIERRTRRAYKLLRPDAREKYGNAVVSFDNETKISYLRAWTIRASGEAIEVKDKDAVDVAYTSYEVFSDKRFKILKFPEAEVGSVVGFEVVQKQRPFVLDDVWDFQYQVPVRRSRYSLQLRPGWEFNTLWENHAEEKPQTSGANQFQWEMTDVPAVEVEPEMPPWKAVAGRMDVKYFPRDAGMRSKTSGSWNDIGAWASGLNAPRRAVTPEITAKVAELTAGIQDPVEKIKALAAFAQRQIRYAAIEIGIGGFQPHAAGEVLGHRYGDCKDKATLLAAMLQAIGVDSYNVLINDRRGEVSPEFPEVRSFNHEILAIRLPDSVPDTALLDMVNHPKLGRLVFFDPTNVYVPLGSLPSYLQNSYGLVVTPGGGEIYRLPLLPASTNRLFRTAKLELSSTGGLTGEVHELRRGGPAALGREQYLEAPPAKRATILDRFLGRSLTNFTVTGASVGNLEQYDENLTLDYKLAVEGYAKSAGNLLVLRPRVVGAKGSNLLSGKPRKYPIEFSEASLQDDDFEIGLPAGYVVDELPQPVKAECAYGTYKSEVKMDGNKLHYKRTYEINDLMVPTQKLNEVRDFFHQIAVDEGSSAILRRSN